MEEQLKIIYQAGTGELVEKKSRFIARVASADSEESALGFIEKVKKECWDATHNCFAYVIGDRQQIQRCSDDGEPSGTAGRPMLDVLLGAKIHNVVVVVTRYFGGTLLGTGGLVRAYSRSVQVGLDNSTILEKCKGAQYIVRTDYNGIGKLQYIAGQMELHTINTDYTDIVVFSVLVPVFKSNEFEKKVIEATAGKARIEMTDMVFYGENDQEIIILDKCLH
ncbi:YigZ family protein [Anaeromicropila populeti]|uniref:Uncharacterized protein, YigZ family n=1 Tax=Anaeromicropila populeti TaxID=37658 RepID=A0A1I6JQW6_9FIRM|nr:YigZ family protein [Anaeromicropila populeti]SFR81354.1 uncharacterized protein, YigZ family [Anaeromicropila populeti]